MYFKIESQFIKLSVVVLLSCFITTNILAETEFVASKAECLVLLELKSHPELEEFPFTVEKINNGYLTLVLESSFNYSKEISGGDMSGMFEAESVWQNKKRKMIKIASQTAQLKDVIFLNYTEAKMNTIFKFQVEQMKMCIKNKFYAKEFKKIEDKYINKEKAK